MCFSNTYNCEVTCLNGYLDRSAVANGTIQTTSGIAHQCTVACVQTAAKTDPGFTDFQRISPIIQSAQELAIAWLPLIILLAIVTLIIVQVLHYLSRIT